MVLIKSMNYSGFFNYFMSIIFGIANLFISFYTISFLFYCSYFYSLYFMTKNDGHEHIYNF